MKFEKIRSNDQVRQFVDSEVGKGTSYTKISKSLWNKYGVSISHVSIGNYAKEVLNAEKREKFGRAKEVEQDAAHEELVQMLHDIENHYLSFDVDSDELDELVENLQSGYSTGNKLVRYSLCSILGAQILICRDLQQKYILGQVKYPKDQLASLNTLCTLMTKINI